MFTKTRSKTRRSRFTTPTSRARRFKRVDARKSARTVAPKTLPAPVAKVEIPAEAIQVVVTPAGEVDAVATNELVGTKPARKPRAPRKVAGVKASKPARVPIAARSLEDLAARLKANKEAARAIRAANKSAAPKTRRAA